MSKAAELAALIGSQSSLSNRNLILNGGMQVAQRGTSVTGITTPSYPTCDRWYFNVNLAGTWTVSQSTDAPAGSGFTNSFKADCTTADASLDSGDYIQFQQRFEGQNLQRLKYGTSSAEKITLSFWVKATKTGTNVLMLYQDDAADMINAQYTINASNTWEYKTLTFVGNTADVITNDNTRGFICIWHLAAGSARTSGSIMDTWGGYATGNEAVGQVNHADSTSNTWQITGVQLEVGEQATPFEHRSYGDELAACQRYYYQLTSQLAYRRYGMSTYDTSTNYSALIPFPVQMRTTPSLSTTGTASDYAVYALNSVKASNAVPSLGDSTVFNALLSGVTASSTAGAAGTLLDNNAAGTFLGFSAEL
ncbi:tail fiber protein [Puniceispirillum phage HMO-2011]|uniref:tail fiber protein n=1 Tax=Puniceispirillum phage HMO-2011 TaxID=948071 RepID=UPI0003518780|nr:tail fiber protein [Puniceispirillum phage HMO-2011]ADW08409.1 putative tail fiber protein [Puniceispirillum phage HMO-2011]